LEVESRDGIVIVSFPYSSVSENHDIWDCVVVVFYFKIIFFIF
jgi:hypothetical protein